jgi:hypothetical protein
LGSISEAAMSKIGNHRVEVQEALDHTETAHLDTPKERAIRNDYDNADLEIRLLKDELRRVRMIPLAKEVEAMFYWRRRAHAAEEMLKKCSRSLDLLNNMRRLHKSAKRKPPTIIAALRKGGK